VIKNLVFLFIIAVFPFVSYASEAPTYVGIAECKMCHLPHFESWNTTKMSKAFELLKPGVRAEAKQKAGFDPDKDYTKEEFCLKCHVTGYGQPGGFTTFEETPEMVGVQCEMCHGPGSVYARMMLKKKGTYRREDYMNKGGLRLPKPDNNACTEKCHHEGSPFVNPDMKFDFENRKALGTHRHDIRYIDMPFDL
jgi:hypothetical protein